MPRFTNYLTLLLLLLITTLSGCEIVTGIFEAGVWVGVLLVILGIALVFWLIRKLLS